MKKAIILTSILFAVIFITSNNSLAQETPVTNWSNPLSTSPNAGTGTHSNRRYLTDGQAQTVIQRRNYGARTLLVLSQSQADASGCRHEVWAWFSGMEGRNNDGQIVITHGPTREYRICPSTINAGQINQAEVNMEFSRKWIVQLSQNPTIVPNARAWINYYTQIINQNKAFVNQVMP